MAATALLDIQGFQLDNNEFIVKELAIRIGQQLNHYLFKPPIPFNKLTDRERRTVSYVERKIHGLRYSSGYMEYTELRKILHAINVDTIYVKGHQKYRFLRQCRLRPEVVNLETDMPQPKMDIGIPACLNHRHGYFRCSINSVNILYNLLNKTQYF